MKNILLLKYCSSTQDTSWIFIQSIHKLSGHWMVNMNMKYNWIKSDKKKQRCVTVAMVDLIKKRALVLSITIQVDKKEKQMLDSNTNKRKIYNKSLNNNENTISLLGKLEFIHVTITGQCITVETLHQVIDV